MIIHLHQSIKKKKEIFIEKPVLFFYFFPLNANSFFISADNRMRSLPTANLPKRGAYE